MTTNMYQIR